MLDDALYTTAMSMFAVLPLLSMRARAAQPQLGSHPEPARLIAVVAFFLLLCLQVRNQNALGVVMVSVNSALRLWELFYFDRLATSAWRWTTQPRPPWRQSRVEAAVLFCVFGISGSSSMAIARRCARPLALPSSLQGALVMLFGTALYAPVLLTVGTLAGRHATIAQLLCRRRKPTSSMEHPREV